MRFARWRCVAARTPGLPRQSAPGHGHPRLTSQRAANCARAPRRRTAATAWAGCIRALPRSRPRAARRRSSTPARRAFERPIAMACLAERAPCFPSRRAESLRGRTRRPAWSGPCRPLVPARALDCSQFWHGFYHLRVFLISVQSWFVSVRNGTLHRPKDRTVVRVSGRALRKFRAGTSDSAALDVMTGPSPHNSVKFCMGEAKSLADLRPTSLAMKLDDSSYVSQWRRNGSSMKNVELALAMLDPGCCPSEHRCSRSTMPMPNPSPLVPELGLRDKRIAFARSAKIDSTRIGDSNAVVTNSMQTSDRSSAAIFATFLLPASDRCSTMD